MFWYLHETCVPADSAFHIFPSLISGKGESAFGTAHSRRWLWNLIALDAAVHQPREQLRELVGGIARDRLPVAFERWLLSG